LTDLTREPQEEIPSDLVRLAGEVAEFAKVLARVLEGKPLLRAFGAPGDWGYGTPIGTALISALRSQQPNADGSAERAALIELLYLRELQASYMRRKQRRACAISREPEAVAEVAAMKADLDRRTPAAWTAARAVIASTTGSAA
jgi:hypothetical protein